MTQTLSHELTRLAPLRLPAFVLALSDCLTLIGRNLRHIIRVPEQMIQMVSLPIILLLMFRYLLGGAIKVDQAYINYVIAGLIVISVGFNLTTTIVGVTDDLRNGIIDRFRSMPMLPSAVLIAHVVAALCRNAVSAAVLILAGFAVGFRPTAGPLEWLAAFGILLLFVTALSWVAVILGITAKSVEGGNGLGMILVFLPYLSSALVPTSTMPPVVEAIVVNQPVSPVVDSVRSLLTDAPAGHAVWLALAWWVPVLLLSVPLAARLFRRRTVG
ncbi:ABC transporter permease [Micromonospora sp. KC606]|uniref:ABC transporter permease n=1 Tax=Micromonospora sp. KC606 TaxID=2530379 RepID=UPI001A9F93DA|nr:ABC transporter permease [Micromonospora sp. KC606]